MEENMKNTIKWLSLVSLLLIVVMSFALISCGGDGSTDSSNGDAPSSYTVTFKQADGTEEKVTVNAGGTATAPTLKQVDGYTVAWENVDLKNIARDMTVNAIKTPVEYTINYELDGGINSTDNAAKYTIESATVLLNNPSKTGYKFLGWYSDAEFTTKVEEIAAGSKGNKTLYANWEAITYTITYNLNGGTNNPGNPTSYDVTAADIILKGASLDGYDFAGWYYDQAFTKPCDKIAAGSTGNITLYAQYDLERYEINYQLNGGKNNNANPDDYNKEEAVAFVAPKRNGYAFKGWFSDINCTEGNEVNGIEKGSTGIVTVYAKWEIETYNVEYVVGDKAEVNPANPSSYTIETVQELGAPLNIKAGYTFEGWYTDRNYTTAIEEINSLFNYTKFYAKFTANVYNIDYNANGGSISDMNPINYTVENVGEAALAVIASEKKGYKFLGWYLDEAFTGEAITEIPASMVAHITLFAKWEIVTYNITYVLNEGVNAEANKSTYTVASNITFAEATKEGTYLIGWFTDEACTKAIKSTDGYAEDLTVYARWWDKYKDPTMKFDVSNVESITANEENSRKDNFDFAKLFDGIIAGGDYYGAGNTEWFGKVGDKLTIVLKEEITVSQINIGGTGNWTYGKICVYDANGDEVGTNQICLTTTNTKAEGVIKPEQPIKVKTITIEVTGLKWTDQSWTSYGQWSFKIAEIEIFVSNPDYVAPEVAE